MADMLKGKTALITGGGSGIGAAIARRFAAEGAKIVITGRRLDALNKTLEGMSPDMAKAVSGDVGVVEDAERMVKEAVAFGGGKLDILVNNAGIDPAGTIVDIPLEQWHAIINTNLNGPFYMMRFAVPYMQKQGGGAIVNISSLAGLRRIPAMPAYSSSKSGLIGLSQAAALDYGPDNIRVNVVCPGATKTEMLVNSMAALGESIGTDADGALDYMTRFTPLRKPATTDEITGAVVFFASDDSALITGAVLPVDAGACIVDPCGAATSEGGVKWGGAK